MNCTSHTCQPTMTNCSNCSPWPHVTFHNRLFTNTASLSFGLVETIVINFKLIAGMNFTHGKHTFWQFARIFSIYKSCKFDSVYICCIKRHDNVFIEGIYALSFVMNCCTFCFFYKFCTLFCVSTMVIKVSICLSIIYLSTYLLPIYLSIYLSTHLLSICLSTHLPAQLSIYLSIYHAAYHAVHRNIYLVISIYI